MKLMDLQRKFAADLMRPLGRGDAISPQTKARYIKPNTRLTSAERLEIYSRSYWYRLIDSMYEDFPGLRAVVGPRAFDKLVRAYLADCPSRSFTLRDLGSQLGSWLRKHKSLAGNKAAVAVDMVALEWAHIEAWDGKEEKILGPEDLLELGPNLRIGLQPYIGLLDLKYPVDDLRIRASANQEQHEVASNAVTKPKARRTLAAGRLKPQQIFLAVHRMDHSIYYRRLARDEFRLLQALREGKTIGRALAKCLKGSSLPPAELSKNLEKWFAAWAELGWLCQV
jgi:hypothetical protein